MSEPEQYRPSRGFLTTLAIVIVAALALAGNAFAHHGQSTNVPSSPGYWLCDSAAVGGVCYATSLDDHAVGTPGVDDIRGNSGNDYIQGFDLGDRIFGGNNRTGASGTIAVEELRGMDGPDSLFAGCADPCGQANVPDRIFGGNGNDGLHSLNGKYDYLEGGAGSDLCIVDRYIDEWKGCETVRYS